jgi:hypothetical protein
MADSGTAKFTLDIADIVEEAFERATGGARALQTGYDYRTARRSLNLLTMEWANRGINLWTLDQGTIPLVKGLAGYQLPADTIDMMEFSLRTAANTINQRDLTMERISVSTYSAIPNKMTPGRPLQVFVQRIAPYPVMTVWPVPDRDDYVLVGWRLRRIHDASAPGSQTMDIPFRFIPAMVAGLAFYLSMKLKEGADRAPLLKQEYEAEFEMAALEDRERATSRFVPRIAR